MKSTILPRYFLQCTLAMDLEFGSCELGTGVAVKALYVTIICSLVPRDRVVSIYSFHVAAASIFRLRTELRLSELANMHM